ncbi:MAG: hypothetical protein IJK34_09040 [Clostridia bacterium]|nr:hypothetical protein [Clostridia bacterium]
MRIYVNNADITDRIVSRSVRWKRYGTFRSSLSFTLEPQFTEGISIEHGMRVKMTDDFLQTVFCGVVTASSEEYVTAYRSSLTVRCQGLEAVAARRAAGYFSTDAQTTGAAAKAVFRQFFSSSNDEGIIYNPALFSEGAAISGYTAYGKSLSKIFDELGAADGSRWWIIPDGTFYFMNKIEVSSSPYCVDLTGIESNALTDLMSFSTVRSGDGYRNVQYVSGANGITGRAENASEISRMARFGGTGRYENAIFVPLIQTAAEANAAAENILRSYEENGFKAVFSTNTYGLGLFNSINITAPQFGLSGPVPFIITDISAKDRPSENGELAFTYTVTAKMSASGASFIRPPEYWTETIGRISG